jgi:hypothetical protein
MGETILSNQITENDEESATETEGADALGVMSGKFCVAVG